MTHRRSNQRLGPTRSLFLPAWAGKVVEHLAGVSREVRLLLVGQFLMNASSFMAIPLMAVYMTEQLRFSPAQTGSVLTVHVVVGRAFPIITGPLVDRFGFRSFIVAGLTMRALGFMGFALSMKPGTLALSTFVIGLGTSAYESAVYGIFARQPVPIVARVFVINNLALNAGAIVGPLLGAMLLIVDPVYPFRATAAVLACLAFWALSLGHLDRVYASRSPLRESWRVVATDRKFLLFLAATFAWWFLFAQLFVLFPLIATRLAGSEIGASYVFMTNGLAGAVCVGLSLVAFRYICARRMLLVCYCVLVATYAAASLHESLVWLLTIVGIYTLVETLILPAIESIVAELAPEGKQSTFFGALGLVWGISGGLGNYVGSWLALTATPWLWGSLAGVSSLGVLLTLVFLTASRER